MSIDDVVNKILRYKSYISKNGGVTFSGGDPMFQPKQCSVLAQKVHELGMNVWAYTGFTYEELIEREI